MRHALRHATAILVLLPLLAAGCEEAGTTAPANLLSINVYSPAEQLYNPWTSTSPPVAEVKVSVTGDAIGTKFTCSQYEPGGALEIPEVPYDRSFQVQVELYASSTEQCGGQLLARGCTKTLKLKEGSPPQNATVLVARVGRFSPTASALLGGQVTSLAEARYGASTTLLPDGRIVVVGGAVLKQDKAKINELDDSDPVPWENPANIDHLLNTIEVYNPENGTFESLPAATLFYPRAFHNAIYLPNVNKVAIIGGVTKINDSIEGSKHVELFDPDTLSVLDSSAAKPLVVPRWGSSATVLDYGGDEVFVLLAGGRGDTSKISYEVWSPIAGTKAFGPSANNPDARLVGPRWNHVAVPVENDKFIFLIGGEDDTKTVATIDVFDKKAGEFLPNGKIPDPLEGDLVGDERGRVGHQAIYVPSKALNVIYVIGGYQDKARKQLVSRIEVIDTKDGKAKSAKQDGFNLCTARALHQAVLMDSNRILITGGIDTGYKVVPGSEMIGQVAIPGGSPEIRSVRSDSLIDQRFMHTMTYLPTHYALVVGGLNSVDLNLSPLQSTELYNYDPSPIPQTAGCTL